MTTELTPEQIVELVDNAVTNFRGQLPELESAIGMLFMGKRFGWKVLYLVHSKATIRKYEKILGIAVRDMFPEAGPDAQRSIGFRIAQKFTSFWKIVNGGEPTFTKTAEIRRAV